MEELYYPCSKNKGTDQLRSYCEADLRLCFCLCRLLIFHSAAQMIFLNLYFVFQILDLDKEEDTLVKKAESEVKEINLRLRVNDLGSEKRELLNWNKTDKPPDQNQRQSTVKTNTNKDTKSDTKKSPATLTFASRTSGTPPATSVKAEGSQMKGKRPLSDQGARIDIPAKGKSSGAEPKSLQKFFQQVKPSKPAWNNNKT